LKDQLAYNATRKIAAKLGVEKTATQAGIGGMFGAVVGCPFGPIGSIIGAAIGELSRL
jgi:uncharacterized membrane protein